MFDVGLDVSICVSVLVAIGDDVAVVGWPVD